MGPIDERGRLALVGSGLLGAAFGFLMVVLLVTDSAGSPSLITGIGVPAALVCAAVGVAIRLSTWRTDGGYPVVATVRQWLADRHVPDDVPAADWVPKLEREADRRSAAMSRIVLSAVMLGLQALRLPFDGRPGHVVYFVLVLGFWGGSAVWQLLVVLPRAKAAATMLAQGVHGRETSTEGNVGE
ncbi:hypothetical protein ASF23_11950 [Curtobacterium sp. Leaf261]|nr:hypothetical protein ASF23_11950 [Curtobacterium sp. Leaf261]